MELSKMVGFCRRVVGPIGVVRPVPGLAPSVSFRLLARLLARLPLYRTIFVVLSRAGSVLVWLAVAPQLWLWPQAPPALYNWRLLGGDAAKGAGTLRVRWGDGYPAHRSPFGVTHRKRTDVFSVQVLGGVAPWFQASVASNACSRTSSLSLVPMPHTHPRWRSSCSKLTHPCLSPPIRLARRSGSSLTRKPPSARRTCACGQSCLPTCRSRLY